MKSIYSLTENQIHLLTNNEHCKYAGEILNKIYRYPSDKFAFKSHISPKLVNTLQTNYSFDLPKIVKEQVSQDGTRKYLFEFKDTAQVESVLMEFYQNYSICISSQVGCAMKCSFCHTGTQGLKRNLLPHEIVSQIIAIKKHNELKKPITNIVFMGQGEPLHNFENIKQAISIITDKKGLSISPKNITVSTSGYLPGIKRFDELGGVNLAFSLHSINDAIRSKLIPLNNKYSFMQVLDQIFAIKLTKNQFIEIEYLMLKGLNISNSDALELAGLLKNRPAIVNLIPFNDYPGSIYHAPSKAEVNKFCNLLKSRGIRVMIRSVKGEDILAACGQLKS